MPMRTVGQLVRARRRELGLTLQQVADMVRCAKSYLSTIENDRRGHPPSEELLTRIESALRLSPGQLVRIGRWQSTPDDVRRHVRELQSERHLAVRLADVMRRAGLDEPGSSVELRRLVERLAHGKVDVQGDRPGVSATFAMLLPTQVPLINNVAAGYPREFNDMSYPARIADEYVSVPDVYDADAFAARVVGDSMEPTYREGDIVVFSPATATKAGSDCFVRFNPDIAPVRESTFQRIYFEEGEVGREQVRLQPLNPQYPPRVVDRGAVAGLYAAVYVVRAVGG